MKEVSGVYCLYLGASILHFSFPSGITLFLSLRPFQLTYKNQYFQFLLFISLHVDRQYFFVHTM
jgi:hypothetical protein